MSTESIQAPPQHINCRHIPAPILDNLGFCVQADGTVTPIWSNVPDWYIQARCLYITEATPEKRDQYQKAKQALIMQECFGHDWSPYIKAPSDPPPTLLVLGAFTAHLNNTQWGNQFALDYIHGWQTASIERTECESRYRARRES